MKVDAVKMFVVANPPPAYGGRYFVFVKLTTDAGIEGIGEVYAATFAAHTVARMIEDVCERHVIGADPGRIEQLWREVYSRGYTQRPDISLVGVLSGIEMACWDIVGKELDRPVHALFGGQGARAAPHLLLSLSRGRGRGRRLPDPEIAARAGCGVREQGFTAVKFDPQAPTRLSTLGSRRSSRSSAPSGTSARP